MANQNLIDYSRYPGPVWTSSHVYGDCAINYHRKQFIINIPKCASSWVKTYTALLGNTPANTWIGANFTEQVLDDYQPIIVLREPVARWISQAPLAQAVYDMIRDKAEDSFFYTNLPNELVNDEHTAPQVSFIKGVDLSRAIFFLANNDFSQNFEHFIIQQGFPTVVLPDYVNRSLEDPDTVERKQIWRNLLSVPKYLEKFKEAYQADYELINTVRFYQPPNP
jgi:hypothetical protein